MDSRGGYSLKILYGETKESGPLGRHAPGTPPGSANEMNKWIKKTYIEVRCSLFAGSSTNHSMERRQSVFYALTVKSFSQLFTDVKSPEEINPPKLFKIVHNKASDNLIQEKVKLVSVLKYKARHFGVCIDTYVIYQSVLEKRPMNG